MVRKLVISCRMMHNLVEIHHVVKNYEQFTDLLQWTDRWTHTAILVHTSVSGKTVKKFNTCFTGTDESE